MWSPEECRRGPGYHGHPLPAGAGVVGLVLAGGWGPVVGPVGVALLVLAPS